MKMQLRPAKYDDRPQTITYTTSLKPICWAHSQSRATGSDTPDARAGELSQRTLMSRVCGKAGNLLAEPQTDFFFLFYSENSANNNDETL